MLSGPVFKLSKREGQPSALPGRLPKTLFWAREQGSFDYEESFIKVFLELPKKEQKQVVRQLCALKQDPKARSLKTTKYQANVAHSPRTGCMVSRGSRQIRFTWEKGIGGITVYWLCRRGDSRLMQNQ